MFKLIALFAVVAVAAAKNPMYNGKLEEISFFFLGKDFFNLLSIYRKPFRR